MTTRTGASLEQQRDRVPAGPVYGFAAFLLTLLVAGAAVTWLAAHAGPMEFGGAHAPARVMPREIESIDQTLFSAHLPSNGDWAAKRRALDSYVWADRARGTVAIPIERAMQIVAERGRVE